MNKDVKSSTQKFSNPVISGFYPDPSVCRVGKDYYLVSSSFEYFPGVPIFHSKDLVNWNQIGHCLTRESQLPLHHTKSSLGIFAPTIRHHQGRFYMITTNMSTLQNFIVWSDKPEGPWSEPIWLEEWSGYDPSLMFDEDGKVYITGTSDLSNEDERRGIYQAEINIETGKLLGERRFIWSGTGGSYPEGPHLYRTNGSYFLMISEGGTEYGHMITVARSDNPFGPFQSYSQNPILTHRSSDSPIQATGHADLIQTEDGSWWAVFLAIRPPGMFLGNQQHHLGRETFLAPVHWTDDGWPLIGQNGRVEMEMEAGTLMLQESIPWIGRDDFNQDTLGLAWNFLRNPYKENWSLSSRPEWLTLQGSSVTLNDLDSPAFVGRRQQHFNCKVSTLLEFEPIDDGQEAGLTVFQNESFHYEIALCRIEGKRQVILRRRIGDLWKIEHQVDYDYSQIILGIEADSKHYKFFYSCPEKEFELLGIGLCAMLSKEVAGGFTGVYFGLYATGNGISSMPPAYFDWFDYSLN